MEDPHGTNTLFAVRNLTGATVAAEVEYFTGGGVSRRTDALELGPHETDTVSIRDVLGLALDPDGFARGFVKVTAVGDPDRAPVLAGDFFQVDVGDDFATGERLVRKGGLCSDASIRFLDFGAGTRLTLFVTQPRGDAPAEDPPSFTVQVYDEPGDPDGAPQPVWTADHALELATSDLTSLDFGSLRFDFSNSLGSTAYAEYSAQGRFSVGIASQCDGARPCDATDCCPPGSSKALTPPLHYTNAEQFPDCEAAIADAVTDLESIHYRNACQATYGGDPLPDQVHGATVVECQVAMEGDVVVRVEVCCPLQ